MITVEEAYLKLYWIWQFWSWENYALQAGHTLNDVDHEMYSLVKRLPDFTPADRHETVLKQIVHRTLVDKHPQICKLRNRLDDWDYYLDRLPNQHKRQQDDTKDFLADSMRPDVLKLMELRGNFSQDLGYNSYPELVYSCDETDQETIHHILNTYLEQHLPFVAHTVQQRGFSWETWFRDLDQFSQPIHFEADEILPEILADLGFSKWETSIKLHIKEGGFGYTGYWNQRNTAHILLPPVTNLRHLLTFFHELGHALSHLMNNQTGLFQTWTALSDECLAVLFEHLAVHTRLPETQKENASTILRLEYCRCALSALFEKELWDNPTQAETAYVQVYQRLGLPIYKPNRWTLDSFRSVDPVYIQNYVIGAYLAEKLPLEPTISWAETLKTAFYEKGLSQPFWQQVNAAT